MRYLFALFIMYSGCGAQTNPIGVSEDATVPSVQYSVTAPYRLTGVSPAGNDGNVYSVLPAAPLAADPWQLVFCYQAYCLTLKQPLDFIPVGEINAPLAYNGNLVASGNVSCSSWSGGSSITWYDATPLHWHISLNATCIDGSTSIRGDWQRAN